MIFMKLHFGPRGIIQIDGAQITHRNFEGREDQYNRDGKRTFSVIIDDEEIKDALKADKNEYGVSWNVKIKAPRNEGDMPFMYLPVKVKFNGRGPKVYLKTGDKTNELDERTVDILDKIGIISVDLDIRPYDDIAQGKPFRSAYLQAIYVTQEVDRFATRMAEEEYPEEMDSDDLPF
jgi:hypothetical protein